MKAVTRRLADHAIEEIDPGAPLVGMGGQSRMGVGRFKTSIVKYEIAIEGPDESLTAFIEELRRESA